MGLIVGVRASEAPHPLLVSDGIIGDEDRQWDEDDGLDNAQAQVARAAYPPALVRAQVRQQQSQRARHIGRPQHVKPFLLYLHASAHARRPQQPGNNTQRNAQTIAATTHCTWLVPGRWYPKRKGLGGGGRRGKGGSHSPRERAEGGGASSTRNVGPWRDRKFAPPQEARRARGPSRASGTRRGKSRRPRRSG